MKTLDAASSARLDEWRARFERTLATSVRAIVDVDGAATPARLADAMEHALLAPGKRLRPLVLLACAAASRAARGGQNDEEELFALCLPAALALEQVHAYSLVHDDLPGMDDDDLRRGRPTVHVVFDEGTAILAGDALLTNAFVHAARSRHQAAAIVEALALAAGSAGMVGGQHEDTRDVALGIDDLVRIHAKKTGCLFRAAGEIGALCVDHAAQRSALSRYGAALGLAFQIGDDVLDVTADPDRAGKRLGRDAARNKVTFVSLLGVDEARARAERAANDAVAALAGMQAPLLVALARFAAFRDH
jgi:farnesyl diphosphate synthase/geranylgeranyl diphosphate synthase type II